MNKDLLKLALVGLTAGFCATAHAAPKLDKEIAMSKCSKDAPKKNGNGNGSSSCSGSCGSNGDSSCSSNCSGNGNGSCNSSCNSTGDQSKNSTSKMKSKRLSAAQKVLQGK